MTTALVKKLWLLRVMAVAITIFAIITMAFASFFTIYCRTYVNGTSMLPTLNSSLSQTSKRDVVYINRFAKVNVGDIIVLDLTDNINFKTYVIKKLVAREGDIVNIIYDNNEMQYNLIVNNEVVDSKPYQDLGYTTYDNFTQYISTHKHDSTRIAKDGNGSIKGVIIKPGELFVLGENWNISKDSALFGPFSDKTLVGKIDIVIKPGQNEFMQVLKSIF